MAPYAESEEAKPKVTSLVWPTPVGVRSHRKSDLTRRPIASRRSLLGRVRPGDITVDRGSADAVLPAAAPHGGRVKNRPHRSGCVVGRPRALVHGERRIRSR